MCLSEQEVKLIILEKNKTSDVLIVRRCVKLRLYSRSLQEV